MTKTYSYFMIIVLAFVFNITNTSLLFAEEILQRNKYYKGKLLKKGDLKQEQTTANSSKKRQKFKSAPKESSEEEGVIRSKYFKGKKLKTKSLESDQKKGK